MDKRTTDLFCHDCGNNFTAELDMDINGNHEIECPHCGHIHYRVVEDGRVTGQRYRSSMGTVVAQVSTGSTSSVNNSGYINMAWQNTDSASASLRTMSGSTT